MHIFKSAVEINRYLSKKQQLQDISFGFVPTMGALHDGHLSLIEYSRQDNDLTVCSIFVNPTQFNEAKDFKQYPRTIEKDLQFLEESGCDVLFLPYETEIYPNAEIRNRQFDFGYLEEIMEGAHRPGHFQGVGQVISRFMEIIPCNKMYLGQKDFQQVKIITHLVNNLLELETEIVTCPIVREYDGLAMSSRNVRLTAEERNDALGLFEALQWAKTQGQSIAPKELAERAKTIMAAKPSLEKIEYFNIVNAKTIHPIEKWDEAEDVIACTAARFPSARLIDNMYLKKSS